MLTVQKTDDDLKIIWSFDDAVPRDPAEFTAVTTTHEPTLVKKCSYYLIGGKKAPLLEWKAFVASLQPLLDHNVKIHFICTSQKINEWLQEIGCLLLGDIVCDPAAILEEKVSSKVSEAPVAS